MSARPIRLLTFDLDDTLWDLAPVLIRAEETTYRWLQHHVPALCERFSLAELRSQRLQIARDDPRSAHRISELRLRGLRAALAQVGVEPERAEWLTREAFAIFLAARHDVELFEAAEQVLEQLSESFVLAAITNGNFDVGRTGLNRYFDFAVSAEHLPRAKPHPEPFLAALERSGYGAQQCIHIGDDIDNDVRGAQAIGMHTIWVNTNRQPWPGGPPPTKEIRHLQELPNAVFAIVERGDSAR